MSAFEVIPHIDLLQLSPSDVIQKYNIMLNAIRIDSNVICVMARRTIVLYII